MSPFSDHIPEEEQKTFGRAGGYCSIWASDNPADGIRFGNSKNKYLQSLHNMNKNAHLVQYFWTEAQNTVEIADRL